MNDKKSTEEAQAQRYADVLKNFLNSYLHPAFGALPKAEVELLILQVMEEIGEISPQPSVYELVSKLKITSSKARKLIYERELRHTTQQQLESQLLVVLQEPIIQRDGKQFVLQIENPLLSDYLREKVKSLGHVTDGSFSPSLVKLSLAAMADLINDIYQNNPKVLGIAKKALVDAGAPDMTVKGIVIATLKMLVARVASEAGEALVDEAPKYLETMFKGSAIDMAKIFRNVIAYMTKKGGK